MSTSLGPQLPEWLLRWFSAADLERKVGDVVVLSTIDGEGWPHHALLSHGEVVAERADRVRLGLRPDSPTTGNLRRDGRATLCLIDRAAAYYIKGHARELAPPAAAFPLARFELAVSQVLEDRDPDNPLTSRLRFTSVQPSHVIVADWRDTLATLLEA